MFQIEALPQSCLSNLRYLSDDQLRERKACRVVADTHPGYPCRVSLKDAMVGETLYLMNYQHLDVNSPYAATHAIFVRSEAAQALLNLGEVPEMLMLRPLSLRAFDEVGFMREADLVDGTNLAARLNALLDQAQIAFVDIHFARPGCFAARARRG